MKIKAGDIIDFIGISWHEPHWEFDHPTVILSPLISYSPNGESIEKMIEDLCIDLVIQADEIELKKEMQNQSVHDEFKWRGWNLKRMKVVAKNRLLDKTDWSSKYCQVVKQTVKFLRYKNETCFEIIKTISK